MGRSKKTPKTQAIRVLSKAGIPLELFEYTYVPQGGTSASSEALGVDEHCVIKTLIMEDSDSNPLVVLMHGDRSVSTRALARHLGVKSVDPCEPKVANRYSGYQVGGTSPFGLRRDTMPIFAERSIQDLERFWINAGRRGLLVQITPDDLTNVLDVHWVEVATLK